MYLPTLLCSGPLWLTPVTLREIKPHRCPRHTPMKNRVVLLFRSSDTTNVKDAVHQPIVFRRIMPLPVRFSPDLYVKTIASASSLNRQKML